MDSINIDMLNDKLSTIVISQTTELKKTLDQIDDAIKTSVIDIYRQAKQGIDLFNYDGSTLLDRHNGEIIESYRLDSFTTDVRSILEFGNIKFKHNDEFIIVKSWDYRVSGNEHFFITNYGNVIYYKANPKQVTMRQSEGKYKLPLECVELIMFVSGVIASCNYNSWSKTFEHNKGMFDHISEKYWIADKESKHVKNLSEQLAALQREHIELQRTALTQVNHNIVGESSVSAQTEFELEKQRFKVEKDLFMEEKLEFLREKKAFHDQQQQRQQQHELKVLDLSTSDP